MKPRARRIALLTAAAGCLVTATLLVVNWSTVRDHVEGWHFQVTRETETLRPGGPHSGLRAATSRAPCHEPLGPGLASSVLARLTA